MCKCTKVSEILTVEIEVIKNHLSMHKYYNHIDCDDDAIIDFVHKYAWVMRETYCGSICRYRETCDVVPQFPNLSDISDGELHTLIREFEPDMDLNGIEFSIVKKHIKDHKWYHGISTYREAIAHFLKKYGWIIKELHKSQSVKNIIANIDRRAHERS
jgi:hypothetical protein